MIEAGDEELEDLLGDDDDDDDLDDDELQALRDEIENKEEKDAD